MTTYSDMLYHLGGVPALAGIPFGPNSKVYFVDPANGSNTNDGLTIASAFADVETGEDACTANQHDTVVYIGGATADTVSAAITWDKSYTHLIGMCAPTQIAQRSRLMYETGSTVASPLLNITASGCMFKNFYIFHGIASATNLINVQVTGGRNYFENVHFAGGGNVTQAVDGASSLFLNGGSENTFYRCTVGVDTIKMGTGGTALKFDGSAGRNIFRECLFNLLISNGGATLVELVDTTSILMLAFFDNCTFLSTSDDKGTAMDSAFYIPRGHTTTTTIYLKDCTGIGFTDWDASNRGLIYMNMGTTTAGGNSGIAQVSNAT